MASRTPLRPLVGCLFSSVSRPLGLSIANAVASEAVAVRAYRKRCRRSRVSHDGFTTSFHELHLRPLARGRIDPVDA